MLSIRRKVQIESHAILLVVDQRERIVACLGHLRGASKGFDHSRRGESNSDDTLQAGCASCVRDRAARASFARGACIARHKSDASGQVRASRQGTSEKFGAQRRLELAHVATGFHSRAIGHGTVQVFESSRLLRKLLRIAIASSLLLGRGVQWSYNRPSLAISIQDNGHRSLQRK